MESHEGRVPRLVPVRVARMIANRPTASCAAPPSSWPRTSRGCPPPGSRPVVCGDSHLGQLRLLRLARARPRDRPQRLRRGPPRRLGVGPAPAGREHLGGRAAERCDRGRLRGRRSGVRSRRTATRSRDLADQPLLARSYQRLDVDQLRRTTRTRPLRAEVARAAQRARNRTSDRALPRFTQQIEGSAPDRRGAAADHPGAGRGGRAARRRAGRVPAHARPALAAGARRLHARRHRAQGRRRRQRRAARLRRAAGGLHPRRRGVPAAQAGPAVGAGPKYVHGESAWHAHQGQRVVEYQQALQTVSDPLLGWATVGERQYYVRQFRNMKGTVPLDAIDPRGARRLRRRRRAPARQGPRAHQRSVDDRRIRRALGQAGRCAVQFARLYADQTEADHAALVKAVDRGLLPVERGF